MIIKHKTFGLRNILILSTAFIVAGISGYQLLQSEKPAQAYPVGCVSQACREAADRAEAAERNAAAAAANAETLEGEINKLNAEITVLEAEIESNQAVAADLAAQISENEAKLELQRIALAKLLEKSYREEKDTSDVIVLLAGSDSIGDFAEKKSRQSSVEAQVTTSTKNIKTLKEELESQKSRVDSLIASAETNRNEITNKRNEQNRLMAKYEANAEAYAADAASARETMQREIAAEIARYNTGGVVGDGRNTYPWASNCPQDDSEYIVVGGYVCQCTSYAGWKTKEYWGIYISSWGNAKSWGNSALNRGYVVDDRPAPHTVGYSTAGTYGHVVWVESVNANGTINITEYNNSSSSKSGLPGDFGARYNVSPSSYRYIHFD